ncbi:hypothetical protein [Sphingomonas crocodyli]|uniref:Flagellar FliJ protein n=1 Tax=Sphingomonas crocodyli TaxID=1979270 RepID=A0A437M6K5_9SPHN|nr:hypothetical protein [Sphingomonas crocodyli]RVT93279.1 hypothetical protein EOD43_05160 [Sphingomonas crocodyli]
MSTQQAKMLVRLRQARMEGAARDLAAARKASMEADGALATATTQAEAADATLADDRAQLGADLANASTRLALVERSLFAQAVARSAANDAAEALRLCTIAEDERRHAMIRAQARHDVLADHAATLHRRAEAQREEQAAAEIDDSRRRPQ